jgi:D-alanine--poly(phosphoribitol) ligase subunit 1
VSLLQTIDAFAETHPRQVAHVHRYEHMTYEELRTASDALASFLLSRFPGDQGPVVVVGHKQNHMLACFLGCAKAGRAYVPVDSSLPPARVAAILRDSQARLILSPEALSPAIDRGAAEVVDESKGGFLTLSRVFEAYAARRPDPRRRVRDRDNFYILYTSGSTGQPKGVQITLGCLSSFLTWAQAELVDGRPQTFLNQAPFSFDLSVMDLYLSLSSGSTLWSVDARMIANPLELGELLPRARIETWVSTPSFAELCLADPSFGHERLPTVRTFVFCGETLTNTCANKLLLRFPQARVFNTYGPTEATVAVTSVRVDRALSLAHHPLPVGAIKPDCELRIVSAAGHTLPEGEKGEVVIVGPSVSPGYLDNPALNERAFFDTELGGAPTRAYRTGDAGYLQGGQLYFCGRLDLQIKLYGHRIELGDIEENLCALPGVENAMVLPVLKDGACTRLVAFVQSVGEPDTNAASALKAALRERLPAYMIPQRIVFKQRFAMTRNGKIDRGALAEELEAPRQTALA